MGDACVPVGRKVKLYHSQIQNILVDIVSAFLVSRDFGSMMENRERH